MRSNPQIGGLENHVFHLSRIQTEQKNEVHLVLPMISGFHLNSDFKTHTIVPYEIEPMSEKDYFGRILEVIKILVFIVLATIRVVRLNRIHQFDIVHVHGGYLQALMGSAIRRFSKCPTVFTIHSSILPSRWFGIFRGKLNPLREIDAIITVSNSIKSEVIALGIEKSRIFAISSGVDTSILPNQASLQDYIPNEVLFVGRLRPVKGVNILLLAIAEVKESIPDIHLTVVGDGRQLSSLKQHAIDLNIEDRVDFAGMVNHNEIIKYFEQAAVLVLPSLPTTKEYGEGRPTVVMESLCIGVPVIASRIGGVSELIQDGVNGLLFKPGCAAELAENILLLLSNRPLREQFSAEAVKIRADVDWIQISERVREVYLAVI